MENIYPSEHFFEPVTKNFAPGFSTDNRIPFNGICPRNNLESVL